MKVSKKGLLAFFLIILFLIALMIVMLTRGNNNLVLLGLLIPLGFIVFIVYKFGKDGVVTLLYVVGGFFLLGSVTMIGNYGYKATISWSEIQNLILNMVAIFTIGLVFILAASFLRKKWKMQVSEKEDIDLSQFIK